MKWKAITSREREKDFQKLIEVVKSCMYSVQAALGGFSGSKKGFSLQ